MSSRNFLLPCLSLVVAVSTLSPSLATSTAAQSTEVRARNNRAAALQQRHLYQQAVEEYEKCLEIDPNNQLVKHNLALAHTDWGIAYFGQKKYGEAQSQWLQALKIEPNLPNPKHNLYVLDLTVKKLGIQLGTEDSSEAAPDAEAQKAESAPKGKGKEKQAETGPGAPPVPGYELSGPEIKLGGADAPKSPVARTGLGLSSDAAGAGAAGGGQRPVSGSQAGGAQASIQSQSQAASLGSAQGQAVPAATGDQAPTPSTNINNGSNSYSNSQPAANSFGGSAAKSVAGDAFDEAPPQAVLTNTSSGPAPAGGAAQSGATIPLDSTGSTQTGLSPGVATYSDSTATQAAQYASPAGADTQTNAQSNAQMDAQINAQMDAQMKVYQDQQPGTSIKVISRPQPPPAPPPPPPAQTVPPPPSAQVLPQLPSDSSLAAATIEEQLTAIEMKVFGKKQKSLPILKRLEKLETGTSGSVGEGTVQERVNRLLHSYGL